MSSLLLDYFKLLVTNTRHIYIYTLSSVVLNFRNKQKIRSIANLLARLL